MTEKRPARPQILAAACLYLGALSAFQFVKVLVLAVGVSTPDGQERVERQIGWFVGGDTSFAEATSIFRVVLTVTAIVAAAGVVFAVHAARGHQPSRVLLTATSVFFLVIGLAGVIGDDYLSVVVGFVSVIFAAQLWSPVVRSYFRVVAGKPPLAQHEAVDPGVTRPATPPATYAAPSPRSAHVTDYPPVPYQHPAHPSAAQHPYAFAPPPVADRRPRSVDIAVWTALVGSIAAAVLSAIALLSVTLTGLDYQSVMAEGGPGADLIRGSETEFESALRLLVVLSSVSVVLSVGGVIASTIALRRPGAGGVVMFVMTVVTLIFSVVGFPLGLPWTAAAIVALVHLRRPESRAWFSRT